MTEIYDEALCDIIRKTAEKSDITLREGVYIQLSGPSFESPQEIKMCRALGADAVGMSTCCEAIAAKHMGMKICGISCISNKGAGISSKPLSHDDVFEAASKAAPLFKRLIRESVINIAEKI